MLEDMGMMPGMQDEDDGYDQAKIGMLKQLINKMYALMGDSGEAPMDDVEMGDADGTGDDYDDEGAGVEVSPAVSSDGESVIGDEDESDLEDDYVSDFMKDRGRTPKTGKSVSVSMEMTSKKPKGKRRRRA